MFQSAQLHFNGHWDQLSSSPLGSLSGSGQELPCSPSSSIISSGSKMIQMKDTTLISFHHMLERFIQSDARKSNLGMDRRLIRVIYIMLFFV